MPLEKETILLFQALVLQGLIASHEYVALACCTLVCKGWRDAVTRPAIAFVDALPEVIKTLQTRIFYPGLSLIQAEMYIGDAVRSAVKGLQDHLYYRPAVRAFISKSHDILHTLLKKHVHPGTLARPSMRTLLVVLRGYPGDAEMGLDVLRLIARYKEMAREVQKWHMFIIFDPADTVVLSDEQQVTALRVVDDFHASLEHTAENEQELNELSAVAQQVHEWIAGGTLLTKQ